MARARTIKRPRKTTRSSAKTNAPKLPFLPESLQAFIARRLVDGIAFAFLGCGVFMLAALLSYHHSDPSWNSSAASAASLKIQNLAGLPGAWFADLTLQTIGLAALAPALLCLIWSLRAFKRQRLSPLWLRGASTIAGTIALSVALAHLPAPEWMVSPTLGAALGVMFLNKSGEILSHLGLHYSHAIFSALFVLPAALFLGLAAALTKAEIGAFTIRTKIILLAAASYSAQCASFLHDWVKYYNHDEFKPERRHYSFLSHLKGWTAQQAAALNVQDASKASPAPASAPDFAPIEMEPKAQSKAPRTAPHIPVVTAQSAEPQSTQQRFALAESNGEFILPGLDLLNEMPEQAPGETLNEQALRRNAELLQNVLADFGVEGQIVSIHPGPVVTLYELEPAPGVKSSRVISLADDIARSMSAISVRCAVVPGRNVIGIELPNKRRQIVYMQELLTSKNFVKNAAHLPLILGKDIGGQPIIADLAKMPHLLVAGTTGSGKSVAVNTMIMSLLYKLPPEKCRFIMIDPKMLELSVYDEIPHLLSPVVTEPGKAIVALKWAVHEMEQRYRAMSKLGVRNIEGYNQRLKEAREKGETIMQKVQTGFDPESGQPTFDDRPLDLTELPYIVIIVDEFADLMLVAGKDVENAIQRLAQMARAAGLHLIMATQRPSVDVITGVVKANFPTRISFQVTSKIDSRTILGEGGAEQLLGMGDMLYMAPGGRITRVHGPFVSDSEVENISDFLRAQGKPSYISDVTEEGGLDASEVMAAMFGSGGRGGAGSGSDIDELYDQAVAIVAREGKASTSFIQRYLQIGYNRAARIVEEMERQGVISPANATGKREVLVSDFSDA